MEFQLSKDFKVKSGSSPYGFANFPEFIDQSEQVLSDLIAQNKLKTFELIGQKIREKSEFVMGNS